MSREAANSEGALDIAWVEAQLRQRPHGLGLPLVYQASTVSTNDDAKAALRAGAGHGACFIAEAQTRGRGRRGRSWSAPPREGLLFSLIIEVPNPKGASAQFTSARLASSKVRSAASIDSQGRDPSALTLAVGLGVHQAVQAHVAQPLQIKWPNDLLCGRSKLAGVLLETELGPAGIGPVIVGVGLNVLTRTFDQELQGTATSTALLGAAVSREQLLVDVLSAIGEWTTRFFESGPTALLAALRKVDALLGQEIRVEGQTGVGAGFDEDGHLLLRQAHGALLKIAAGTVEWLS